MHPVLQRNVFLRVENLYDGVANGYDVLDPETGEELLHCREPMPGFFTRMIRFFCDRRFTPVHIEVTTPSGEPVLSVRRGVSLGLSKVDVFDKFGNRIGGLQPQFLSIRGAFDVVGANETVLCNINGKWTAWDFSFEMDGKQFGRATKKPQGDGLKQSAIVFHYVFEISESVPPDNPLRILMVAAVSCIHMVLME